MKLKTCLSILALVLTALAPLQVRAQTGGAPASDPAYLPIDAAIDLKAIQPEVNINLPRFLLKEMVSEMDGGTNDPFAATGVRMADLVKDVKLIRVVVIDTDKGHEEALAKGVAKLRAILESKWVSVATVPGENIGIYALGDASGDSMAGLALLVHDGTDVVIANVVGKVSLSKIVKIASRFDKVPKDLLKQLGATAGAEAGKGEPATAKAGK